MEFNFSINALFKEKLVKVKSNLLPENHVPDRRGDGDVVSKMSVVLDKMGVVSAKAQNLPVAITSAAKLRNSEHVVYILTDPEGNRGHGTVVGILKVGCKKLFTYDLTGVQWEMEPLCVLDFYVHESKQRSGCGKLLFDYMLKDQFVSPHHLALDQPSEMFLSFMCKHYGLDSIIPQTNSFVVYDSFFDGRSDKGRGSGNHTSNSKKNKNASVKALSRSGDATPLPSFGRHSAKKAGSVMAEYMQDSSATTQNGTRHGSSTNQPSTPVKMVASKPQVYEEANGVDPPTQTRPSSLPHKLSQHASPPAPELSHASDLGVDVPDVGGDTAGENGTTAPTPEELLNEDNSETDGTVYQNGDSIKHLMHKVSNIPLGENKLGEEDDELSEMMFPLPVSTNQNGHPFNIGTAGVRDVRIKKTMFKNLSPYRK